jgi:L-lactate dehydrogenase
MVGATAAYALVMRGIGREIVLVDRNQERAEAEAADILHAVPFANSMDVRAGGYQDLTDSQVVIITAGTAQKPGETRLDLLERNAGIVKSVVRQVLEVAPDTVLLVTTNPVDVMTHLAARYAAEYGLPRGRVMGSGTTLDTARFRALLGGYLGVDSKNVHGYVLGEHGDSEMLTWSLVAIGGIPLEDYCWQRGIRLDEKTKQRIQHDVRDVAYDIIEGKGATYYGIGSALARIVEAVLERQNAILTVCTPVDEVVGVQDVTVALPNLISREGSHDALIPPLSLAEKDALRNSARVIRNALEEFDAQRRNREEKVDE